MEKVPNNQEGEISPFNYDVDRTNLNNFNEDDQLNLFKTKEDQTVKNL